MTTKVISEPKVEIDNQLNRVMVQMVVSIIPVLMGPILFGGYQVSIDEQK